MHRLQGAEGVNQTEYIIAVKQLQQAWELRYKRANDEFKRFARRIDHADAMAGEYFAVQRGLTNHINNPQRRQQAEVIAAAEYELYLKWREQAYRILS